VQLLLGPNLHELLSLCGGEFTLKWIINIGIDLLYRIEIIHSHGILHRDIKPKNIVFGNFSTQKEEEKDMIYLLIMDYQPNLSIIIINIINIWLIRNFLEH